MKLSKLDAGLSICALALFAVGLMSLYSSGLAENDLGIFWRYLIMTALALGLWLFFTMTDYHDIAKASRWIYLGTILLLIATLLFGPVVRGSQRWLGFGQFRFQTSELAKLAVLLGLSKWLYTERGQINTVGLLLRTVLYVGAPAALVMVQPDLGSTLTIMAIWGGLLLVSRAKLKVIAIIAAIGIVLSGLAWEYALHDFQRHRILVFLNPEADLSGQGYNVRQAIIAVGSGGVFGTGLGKGVQSQLSFLPERHTDFAFASISEELGAVGSALIVIIYSIFLHRIWIIAKKTRDDLGAYLALGTWWWFFFQGTVNIAMNLGLMPVTGIPLPFISYGGSALIVSAIALGILNNISWQVKTLRF